MSALVNVLAALALLPCVMWVVESVREARHLAAKASAAAMPKAKARRL